MKTLNNETKQKVEASQMGAKVWKMGLLKSLAWDRP